MSGLPTDHFIIVGSSLTPENSEEIVQPSQLPGDLDGTFEIVPAEWMS